MNDSEQLPLFDDESPRSNKSARARLTEGELTPQTPLSLALEVYIEALQYSGKSYHTVRAFRSDLGLLATWAKDDRPIGQFGTHDLNLFLHWMLNERDKPCSPKTYARRVTTLKHFFGYLHEIEANPRDPSNALIQRTVNSPLPEVLEEKEVEQGLDAAEAMRYAQKPDARPYFLLKLLLETGMKKGECVALFPQDLDEKAMPPKIWVRYANPRMRYKERRIEVTPELISAYNDYMIQRRPRAEIFDCTPRNLEYVLRDISIASGLEPTRLSFETIRWTCALADYKDGMEPDKLRQKLGVSRVTWAKTREKLAQLSGDDRDGDDKDD
jgi:integrase/recombinase XerD